MACWICGSAKTRANTNASSPPMATASRPRQMIRFSMGSVAGEAEEVASVVHELVDVRVAAEHRDRALVDADEVVQRDREQGGAGQPEHRLGAGNDQRGGCGGGVRHRAHEASLGSCVPRADGAW